MSTKVLSFERSWHIFLACTEQLYFSSLRGSVIIVAVEPPYTSRVSLFSAVAGMFRVGQQVTKYVFSVHSV